MNPLIMLGIGFALGNPPTRAMLIKQLNKEMGGMIKEMGIGQNDATETTNEVKEDVENK